MIIFKNSLIKFGYAPATDIAVAEYPNLHEFLIPEIKHSTDLLVDAVKSYYVKKFKLDGTKTSSNIEVELGRTIAIHLVAGL